LSRRRISPVYLFDATAEAALIAAWASARYARVPPALRHFSNGMEASWPELPYEAWRPTRDTLHMYLQIVGKVRLALAPMEPQWGQVPLYVTARGLNTSPIPHPAGVFDIDVDLVDHVVAVRTVRGAVERIRLEPRSVADFYAEFMGALAEAGVPVTISELPSEVPDPIRFPHDVEGKTSPVQFYWGSFDLAYYRFSGRPVAPPPDADVITQYGGDAEQAGAGFWPGDARLTEPAFFAYTYPRPDGIEQAEIEPVAGYWSVELGEFLLPYETVRTAADPRRTLLDFLETTYRAGTGLAGWE
jgi:hypothetical protein